jgi:hypothetical protein
MDIPCIDFVYDLEDFVVRPEAGGFQGCDVHSGVLQRKSEAKPGANTTTRMSMTEEPRQGTQG